MDCLCHRDNILSEFRSNDWVHHLQKHVSEMLTPKQVIAYIDQHINEDIRMIEPTKFVETMQRIEFNDARLHAISAFNKYLRALDEKDIIMLLNTFPTTDLKIEALRRAANAYVDRTPDGVAIIISKSFTYENDRQAAKKVFDTIIPKNALFGSMNESTGIAFVFAIAKSMDQNINVAGKTVSKLNYVKDELKKTVATQLNPKQKFNVFSYYISATRMNGMWYDGTPNNAKTAQGWIDRQTSGNGANLKQALEYAFDTKDDLRDIYVVMDSLPANPMDNPTALKDLIKQQVTKRKANVALHMIAFLSTSTESKEQKEKIATLLYEAAMMSGGTFRIV